MKFLDHYRLCGYLCRRYKINGIKGILICAGGLEPDVSIYSFMKGVLKKQAFGAHSWIYIKKDITRLCVKLDKSVWTLWDYFLYGRLTHFLADAFTRPHNVKYRCFVHKAYELRKLHPHIVRQTHVRNTKINDPEFSETETLVRFINARHKTYMDNWRNGEQDADNIFYVNEVAEDYFQPK